MHIFIWYYWMKILNQQINVPFIRFHIYICLTFFLHTIFFNVLILIGLFICNDSNQFHVWRDVWKNKNILLYLSIQITSDLENFFQNIWNVPKHLKCPKTISKRLMFMNIISFENTHNITGTSLHITAHYNSIWPPLP